MKTSLHKLHNPTKEQAKDFFAWQIEKHPIFNGAGQAIPGFAEFRSTRGNTLHVTNDTYNPAQPGEAYAKTTEAMDSMELAYSVNGVGEFDNGANIFAQFDVSGSSGASRYGYNGGGFSINGKEYKGFITMGKGSDESFPLSYWLTIVCIVCANTWRAARRARKNNAQSVTMKQTKNSNVRFEKISEEIVGVFKAQETVQQTLEKMAQTAVSLSEAERAFLGLLKPANGEQVDLSKTGKTRLQNTLERYLGAYRTSPGVNTGATREDWFNAVTNVDTHGNTESKKFDADKQYISSEFGTYATRKGAAFEAAASDDTWQKLVYDGSALLDSLLAKSVTIVEPVNSDFSRLVNK